MNGMNTVVIGNVTVFVVRVLFEFLKWKMRIQCLSHDKMYSSMNKNTIRFIRRKQRAINSCHRLKRFVTL